MSDYKVELMLEVWDNKHGTCIEVGNDRDGLELIEIRAKDENGKDDGRLTFDRYQARLVATSILRLLDEPQ